MHTLHASAWWLLAGAVPVLLLGESLLTTVKPLAKLDLPPAIVGGLIISVSILLINLTGIAKLTLDKEVTARAWNWIITPEPKLKTQPSNPVYLPLSTAFFCCVGLNASWAVAKKGSWQLLLMLGLATVLGILQNLLGVWLCRLLHQNILMGLVCGSVTLTGGPSTALGFADTFAKAGFPAADVVGAAAAMFGIVCASLLAGAFGGQLIRRVLRQKSAGPMPAIQPAQRPRVGLYAQVRLLQGSCFLLLQHVLIILACMKLGAWVSLGFKTLQVPLPVYMGGMILAVMLRNLLDSVRLFTIQTSIVHAISSICLGLFLAMAMTSLNLLQLKSLALPMLIILFAQVGLMILFAGLITFTLMGRDYDAAVMAAGHVGFGLGITPNAVATMDVLEQNFGTAPRAVLIVTIVGAFLIDFTNSLIINVHLNLLHQ